MMIGSDNERCDNCGASSATRQFRDGRAYLYFMCIDCDKLVPTSYQCGTGGCGKLFPTLMDAGRHSATAHGRKASIAVPTAGTTRAPGGNPALRSALQGRWS